MKFTAPGSGASGTFTGGSTTASVTTGSSGTALAPAFTANGVAGTYSVTASVSGVSLPAAYTLTNQAAAGSGSLTGAGTSSASAVNLTVEGSTDWVHWGDGSLNRKAGVTPQLSTFMTVPGGGGPWPVTEMIHGRSVGRTELPPPAAPTPTEYTSGALGTDFRSRLRRTRRREPWWYTWEGGQAGER